MKVISLLFSNKQQGCCFFYYIRASDFVIQNKISICIIFFVASESHWCPELCWMSLMMCVRVAVWADGGARCPHPGGRMSECSFTLRYLIVTPHRRNRESTHVLVTHSELLHSAFKESVLWNFHPEQIFNCWGCLRPTRVPGPAPGVRFLLSLPIGTEKLHRGLYAFFLLLLLCCCCSPTLA